MALIAQQAVASYTTDPDDDEPKGAVILHLDPQLLPEDWEEIIRHGVEAEGGDFTGAVEWVLYELEFVDDDRVALYMDHDATAVVRGTYGCKSVEEAHSRAREWVGDKGQESSFHGIPGVFQAGFITAVAARDLEPMPADMMWVPDSDSDEAVPVRQFPPRVDRQADEGQWSLLPRAAVEELLAERGW